jgi:cell division inhibitor SulA
MNSFSFNAEQLMLNNQSHQQQSFQQHNHHTIHPMVGRTAFSPVHSDPVAARSTPLLQLIGSLAAQTDRQQGWLLVIAPPQPLTKSMLNQLNINSKRIMVIQQRQIAHFDNFMRDALTCSTCCAVISFLPSGHPQLPDYEYLSAKYGTALVNVNTSQHTFTQATH